MSRMNPISVKVGDQVLMRPDFGSGDPIHVTVTGVGTQHGREVFDYKVSENFYGYWAYLHQVDSVLPKTINVGDVYASVEIKGMTVTILYVGPDKEHCFGQVDFEGRISYDTFKHTYLSEPHWTKKEDE